MADKQGDKKEVSGGKKGGKKVNHNTGNIANEIANAINNCPPEAAQQRQALLNLQVVNSKDPSGNHVHLRTQAAILARLQAGNISNDMIVRWDRRPREEWYTHILYRNFDTPASWVRHNHVGPLIQFLRSVYDGNANHPPSRLPSKRKRGSSKKEAEKTEAKKPAPASEHQDDRDEEEEEELEMQKARQESRRQAIMATHAGRPVPDVIQQQQQSRAAQPAAVNVHEMQARLQANIAQNMAQRMRNHSQIPSFPSASQPNWGFHQGQGFPGNSYTPLNNPTARLPVQHNSNYGRARPAQPTMIPMNPFQYHQYGRGGTAQASRGVGQTQGVTQASLGGTAQASRGGFSQAPGRGVSHPPLPGILPFAPLGPWRLANDYGFPNTPYIHNNGSIVFPAQAPPSNSTVRAENHPSSPEPTDMDASVEEMMSEFINMDRVYHPSSQEEADGGTATEEAHDQDPNPDPGRPLPAADTDGAAAASAAADVGASTTRDVEGPSNAEAGGHNINSPSSIEPCVSSPDWLREFEGMSGEEDEDLEDFIRGFL